MTVGATFASGLRSVARARASLPRRGGAEEGKRLLTGAGRGSVNPRRSVRLRAPASEVQMDDAGFLQAVLDSPEDDALRLVYADWLEERGDPRGEYLRCQCARAGLRPADRKRAALLKREAELRRQHPDVILPWQRRLTLGHIKHLVGRTGRDRADDARVKERS